MSTILKALRRLEQERTKGAERPLREQVTLSRARRRGPWSAWLATAAALALGFAATWAVLTTFGDDPLERHSSLSDAERDGASLLAEPPSASTASGLAAPPNAPGTAPTPPVASPPPAPPTVRVAAGAPAAAGVPAPAPPMPPAPPRAIATPPSIASAQRAVPDPAPAAPERIYADEEPVLTAPISGRAPRLVDDDEPPSRAAADVPVDVVRTSWHPQADRRAAWIAIGGEAPREVREGEWVGAYEVRAIEPDGVLFADGPLLVHRPVGAR